MQFDLERDWRRRVQGGELGQPRFGLGTLDLQSRLGLSIRAGSRLGDFDDLILESPQNCLRRRCLMLACPELPEPRAFVV